MAIATPNLLTSTSLRPPGENAERGAVGNLLKIVAERLGGIHRRKGLDLARQASPVACAFIPKRWGDSSVRPGCGLNGEQAPAAPYRTPIEGSHVSQACVRA